MSPTVLTLRGWRLFMFPNEGNEPMHVHARKGDVDCKYALDPELYEIREVYAYNLTPALRREIRKIIFDSFEDLTQAWRERCKP